MIPQGIEQRLGHRTFALLLSRRTTMALIFILIGVVLGLFRNIIATGLLSYFGNPVATTVFKLAAIISLIALVIFLLGLILFIVGYVTCRLQYVHYTFTLEEFGLKLKRGIADITEISIPYRQIQAVDVKRPFMYRIFGVSRLVMLTAGEEDDKSEHEETDTVFDPIDADLAEEVRQILERKIGVQITSAEVSAAVK